MWSDTPNNQTPWLGPTQYPFQSQTDYDVMLDYDLEFMTYDGVIISDPGWGEGQNITSPWLVSSPIANSWNSETNPETSWT